jgi:ATP-binding cassette, subfamily B, bacterial
VDGTDLSSFDPSSCRRHLTAVFQDYVRYPLSAADNVAWGAGGRLGDDDLLGALRDADAVEAVDGLPAGVGTVLGRDVRDGAELFGGQWQKLAVAWALARVRGGAAVLVLDEPTASLDVRSEARLFERILTLTSGLTTLLISHRFANVRRADRIVVLEDGVVTEDGSHDVLMRAGGRYAEMFRTQAAHFLPERQAVASHAEEAP